MRRALTTFAAALLSLFFCAAQETVSCIPPRARGEADLAYKPGERLEYMFHYNWGLVNSDVGVGIVTLDTVTINRRKYFHSRAFGKTSKFYDRLFRIREDFQSWFTRDGLVPFRFMRDTREGNYYAINRYDYIWTAPEPYIAGRLEKRKHGERQIMMPLSECLCDPPTFFYMARNLEFEKAVKGVYYKLNFAVDDTIYEMYFKWVGNEELLVGGAGKVKTMKLTASLKKGMVVVDDMQMRNWNEETTVWLPGDDITIWVSDDANRIPIYFELPLKVGVASGRQVAFEGLKYPLGVFED